MLLEPDAQRRPEHAPERLELRDHARRRVDLRVLRRPLLGGRAQARRAALLRLAQDHSLEDLRRLQHHRRARAALRHRHRGGGGGGGLEEEEEELPGEGGADGRLVRGGRGRVRQERPHDLLQKACVRRVPDDGGEGVRRGVTLLSLRRGEGAYPSDDISRRKVPQIGAHRCGSP